MSVFGNRYLKKENFIYWLICLIAFYFFLTAYVYFFADLYIFQPPQPSYLISNKTLKITTADGETIVAVYLPNKKGHLYDSF